MASRSRLVLARLADLPELLEWIREFYAYEGIPYRAARARRALRGLLSDPDHGRAWWITSSHGERLGYAIVCLGYSVEFGGRNAFIDEFYLREAHRGQGIGSRVLADIRGYCRRAGVGALHLEVERHNRKAQRLYRKQGFKDHDRYLMTRWLKTH